jgi:DNA-binding beta-propeller fold protein YncE
MKTLSVILCLVLPTMLFSVEKSLSAKFIFAFGEKGDSPQQMFKPQGVAADVNGNIYVTDTGNHRLQKFTPQGELISFIGGFGWEREQFQIPMDIFVYNSLDIYIADFDNSRIERYDRNLNSITSYRSNQNWNDRYQFEFPTSVCVSMHGDFFIVDSENDRIIKLNPSFEPEISFGDYDWGQGVLEEASYIYVSKSDIVYVTDSAAHKILVYDYFGNYLFDIGADVLESPRGLCVDELENIFVADAGKNQIFAFDKTGRQILQLGSLSTKFAGFHEPSDVTIYRDKMYIADTQNNRIQIFQLEWEQ